MALGSCMKIQPTRKSQKGHYGRKGQTVYVDVGIWHNKKTGYIHIAGPEESRLHTTVSDVVGSRRCHPNLYNKLREILIRERRW